MPDPTLTIRPAEPTDVPGVAALCRQWAAEGLTRNYRADTEEELSRRLGECFLVAESCGSIVGFAIGAIRSTEANEFVEGVLDDQPLYLEVQDVYVAAGRRGRGIGASLMRELIAGARTRGVTNSLVYSANRDYLRTARFYEKLGYGMWHIHMTRREEGEGRARND